MKTIYVFSKKEHFIEKLQELKKFYRVSSFNNSLELEKALKKEAPNSLVLDGDSTEKGELNTLLDLKVIKTLVLNELPSLKKGEELLSYGVKGYGNLNMNIEYLKQALEVILEGDIWVYPALMTHIIKKSTIKVEEQKDLSILTTREKEIAQLVADGLSNIEIADSLTISESTVKLHLNSIYQKLNIHSRLKLALIIKD